LFDLAAHVHRQQSAHREHSVVERDAEMAHRLRKTPRAALKAPETAHSSYRPASAKSPTHSRTL
jgi:hypothetical protein